MSAHPWIAWYPADYQAKTSHLTFEQSEAYRRLLEAYYSSSGKLTSDRPSLYRICRAMTDSERAAVDTAENEFFTNENGNLHHNRADEELAVREQHRARLSEAGHRGGLIAGKGRPKEIIGLAQARSQSQSQSQAQPQPEKSKALFANANGAWDSFWKAYPRKTAKQTALKAWGRVKAGDVAVLMVALEAQRGSEQWQRGVIPHAATWLNQRRWEDEAQINIAGSDLGQCMWNRNGERGIMPRCGEAGVEERDRLIYCKIHQHLHGERIR